MTDNTSIPDARKELICSEAFEDALTQGSEKAIEIDGTHKQKNRDNYSLFYDIMLRATPHIEEICNKRKKDRTASEVEELKNFKKSVSAKYKMVKEMIFIPEDEKLDENGVSVKLPKKAMALVDRLSAVVQLLRYIGHGELEAELARRGITLSYAKLEDVSDAYGVDAIHRDIVSVFDTSCSIQKDIDDANREITEGIFTSAVPQELQYDKDTNPTGLKNSDFKKLVALKVKLIKSITEEAAEKTEDAINNSAYEKTNEIARNELIREKLMTMSAEIDNAEGEG